MSHPLKSFGTCLLILALLPVAVAAAAPGYEVYVNARYGFSAEVPAHLVRQAVPENGDGQAFRSRGGGLRLTLSAIPDDDSGALDTVLADATAPCLSKPPQYFVRRADWFVVSCRTTGGILYQRTIRAGQGEAAILTSLVVTYPEAERSRWDTVVAHVSSSLRPAPPLRD